jgi:hypothetical protein
MTAEIRERCSVRLRGGSIAGDWQRGGIDARRAEHDADKGHHRDPNVPGRSSVGTRATGDAANA